MGDEDLWRRGGWRKGRLEEGAVRVEAGGWGWGGAGEEWHSAVRLHAGAAR